jgi:hypothetical protein
MTLQQLGVAAANTTDDAVAAALAGDTRKLKLVSKSKPVRAAARLGSRGADRRPCAQVHPPPFIPLSRMEARLLEELALREARLQTLPARAPPMTPARRP